MSHGWLMHPQSVSHRLYENHSAKHDKSLFVFLVRIVQGTSQIIQAIAIALGCLLELEGKILSRNSLIEFIQRTLTN